MKGGTVVVEMILLIDQISTKVKRIQAYAIDKLADLEKEINSGKGDGWTFKKGKHSEDKDWILVGLINLAEKIRKKNIHETEVLEILLRIKAESITGCCKRIARVMTLFPLCSLNDDPKL